MKILKLTLMLAMLLVLAVSVNAVNIGNCTDLQNINSNLTADYVLTNDIDCSGVANFNQIVGFTGTLDGAGFEIQNVFQNASTNSGGMFINATIGAYDEFHNITFSNVSIHGGNRSAIFGGTIDTLYINDVNFIDSHTSTSGEITAIGASYVDNFYSKDITINSSTVEHITDKWYHGGLVGTVGVQSTFSNIEINDFNNTGDGRVAGSLAGQIDGNTSTISNVSVDNVYSLTNRWGSGFIGYTTLNTSIDIFNASFTNMNLSSTGSGLLGGIISLPYDTGDLTINQTYFQGVIDSAGGTDSLFFGYKDDGGDINIHESYATGTVESVGTTGAFVGKFQGTDLIIKNSYATFNTTVTNTNSGGFVASLATSSVTLVNISNSYVVWNDQGTVSNTGGIIGNIESTATSSTTYINNVFSANGSVSNSVSAGGAIGRIQTGTTTLSNFYWQNNSIGAVACEGNPSDNTGCNVEDTTSYYYDSLNQPMLEWDFSTPTNEGVWVAREGDTPCLEFQDGCDVQILTLTSPLDNTVVNITNAPVPADEDAQGSVLDSVYSWVTDIYFTWFINGVENETGVVSNTSWVTDDSIISGLTDVGFISTPTTYQDTKILISSDNAGTWTGWQWNDTDWVTNSTLVSGLASSAGSEGYPSLFNDIDGTLMFIHGDADGTFSGYDWNGNGWDSNSNLVSGLADVGTRSTATIFTDGNTVKLITGENLGTFIGYQWNGSGWDSNSSIVSGLGDIGSRSRAHVYEDVDGTLKLIGSRNAGTFVGFYWTGSTWTSDSTIVDGLGDVGSNSYATTIIFDGGRKLISGEQNGNFFGFSQGINITDAYNFNNLSETNYNEGDNITVQVILTDANGNRTASNATEQSATAGSLIEHKTPTTSELTQVGLQTINSATYVTVLTSTLEVPVTTELEVTATGDVLGSGGGSTATCRIVFDSTEIGNMTTSPANNQHKSFAIQSQLVNKTAGNYTIDFECRRDGSQRFDIENTELIITEYIDQNNDLIEVGEDIATFTINSSTYQLYETVSFNLSDSLPATDYIKDVVFKSALQLDYTSTGTICFIIETSGVNSSEYCRYGTAGDSGSGSYFHIDANVTTGTETEKIYAKSTTSDGDINLDSIHFEIFGHSEEQDDVSFSNLSITSATYQTVSNDTIEIENHTGVAILSYAGFSVRSNSGSADMTFRLVLQGVENGSVINRDVLASNQDGLVSLQEEFENLSSGNYTILLQAQSDNSDATITGGELISFTSNEVLIEPSTYTVYAYSSIDLSALSNFTVTTESDNSSYTSENGFVIIPVTVANDNVTVSKTGFTSNVTLNHSTSSDLNVTLVPDVANLSITITPSDSVLEGVETTVTGVGCPSELNCSLYRDGSLVSNPDVATLSVGVYQYIYNTSGNANYSASTVADTLTINSVDPTCYPLPDSRVVSNTSYQWNAQCTHIYGLENVTVTCDDGYSLNQSNLNLSGANYSMTDTSNLITSITTCTITANSFTGEQTVYTQVLTPVDDGQLIIGMCLTGTGSLQILWMIIALTLTLLIGGYVMRVGVVMFAGAIGLMAISWYIVACVALIGAILGISSIFLMFYSIMVLPNKLY